TIRRSFFQEYLDRVAGYHQTQAYKKAYQKRKVWVEPLFGEAQQWHGLKRFRLRGLAKVNCEAVVTATGQNLKRLLAAHSWGRRWFPNGAAGVLVELVDDLIGAANGLLVLHLCSDNQHGGQDTTGIPLELRLVIVICLEFQTTF